jgi:hypothetical protein
VIHFSTLLRYGNPLANLATVDSYLQPRHLRWTLLFLDLLLLWFFAGMYLKNTRSISSVLHNKINQDASVRPSEVAVAFLIPLGNAVGIGILRSLFRISESRLRTVLATNVHSQREMLRELKKELDLRFLMAYCLSTAVLLAILWYYVNFTVLYGWQVGWFWLATGALGAVLRFLIYDLLECLLCTTLAKGYLGARLARVGHALSQRRYRSIAVEEA